MVTKLSATNNAAKKQVTSDLYAYPRRYRVPPVLGIPEDYFVLPASVFNSSAAAACAAASRAVSTR